MTASETFENLLKLVQSSFLNFKIELSPFSATIHLKKSFIRNQHGTPLLPPPGQDLAMVTPHAGDSDVRVQELMKKNEALNVNLNAAARETEKCNEVIEHFKNQLEQKQQEIDSLSLNNIELEKETKTLSSELYNTRIELTRNYEKHTDLKVEKEVLEKKVLELQSESRAAQEIQEEKLAEKDAKLQEISDEKLGLEEKINSLLDVLYGCDECGYHGDYCECDASEDPNCRTEPDQCELRQTSSHCPSSVTPEMLQPAPATSTSPPPPWTPPPTPPCVNCGGENYGPCPTNLCFACIPSFTPPCTGSSSPSRTPPGTPPPPLRGSFHR